MQGLKCGAEQILITTGDHQTLDLIAQMFIDPGDTVVVADPSYPGGRTTFAMHGAKVLRVPADEYGFIAEKLPDPDPGIKLVMISPPFHDERWSGIPVKRKGILLAWARECGAYIVEDGGGNQYRFTGHATTSMQLVDQSEQTIVFGALALLTLAFIRYGLSGRATTSGESVYSAQRP
jgi:GntR family transcriptional regulator/MocR family aminotransferase